MKCGSNKFCLGFEPDHKVYCYGNSGGCLWGQNSCNTDQDCNKYSTSSAKYTDGDTPDCKNPNLGWRVDACPDPYVSNTDSDSYTILCSGTDGTLWKREGLNASWEKIQDDSGTQNIISICTGSDGMQIVGCNNAHNVVTKTSWDAPKWIGTNYSCCVLSVAVGEDGTVIGVGTDNQLYSKPDLNSDWMKTESPGEWITSIAIAPDGSLFCVGGGNQIWKKDSYRNLKGQTWQYMGGCCVKAITIAPDGTFIGVGTDDQLYSKPSYTDLTASWTGPYPSSCCAISITTIANRNMSSGDFNSIRTKFNEVKSEYVDLMDKLQTSCLDKRSKTSDSILNYRVGNNNPTVLYDSTTNSNANIINNPTYSDSGGPNNSGYLTLESSKSQYILTSKSLSSHLNGTSISVFLWVYPTGDGIILTELGQSAINENWHDSQIEIVNGVMKFSVWPYSIVLEHSVPLNQWLHVGFVYNQRETKLSAYVNGEEVSSGNMTRQSPNDLFYAIGGADTTNLGNGGYGNFKFARMQVYNTALTSAEVVQKYHGLNVAKQCKRAAELNAYMQTSLIQMSNLLKKNPQTLPAQKDLLDLAAQLEEAKNRLLTSSREEKDLGIVAEMNHSHWLLWVTSTIIVFILILIVWKRT